MKHQTGGTGWPSGNILDFHAGLPIFPVFVLKVMHRVILLISLLPEAPPWGLRPVAFATSATWLIRHWSCY